MPGKTSTACSGGRRTGSERISPRPRIQRGFESTHTGTSAPVASAAAISRGSASDNWLACASRRSAAAASAEPPPRSAPAGSRLCKLKGAVELLGRFLVLLETEVRPAERIDDVAIVRALIDPPLEQSQPIVQVAAVI